MSYHSLRILSLVLFSLAFAATHASAALLISNGGFELPQIASNSYEYNPEDSYWTFSGMSGINNGNNKGFSITSRPEGVQNAFLQKLTSISSISQDITITRAGTYILSYMVAGRAYYTGATGGLTYKVKFGDNVIGTDSTVTAQAFTAREYEFFTDVGTYTLMFETYSATSFDCTSYFDSVSLVPVPEPSTWAMLTALPALGLALMRRKKA